MEQICNNIFNFLSLLISILSFVISFRAFKISQKTFEEEYQARIVAFFEVRNNKIYLVIKNVGKSIASNVTVSFNPKLSTSIHSDFNKIIPLITDYQNYTLVPNQELAEIYDVTKYIFRRFTIKINYKNNMVKPLSSEYTLDTYYLDNYIKINNM